MARKQHLINVHTSTGTTAPTGASLYLGEIAVQHTPNDPALWIKVGSSQSSEDYEKFIGETEITSLIEDSKILGSGYTYSGIPYVNSATSIADAYSALTKETVDLTDRVAENEYVFAIALNDLDDRIEEISGNTGAGAEPLSAAVISLSASVVSEAADITALSSATESHVTDTDIHVTSADKTAWNGKQDAISDLSVIRNNALSGASAYTDVRALSSATATHIADNGKHLPAVTSSDNGKVLQVDDGDWSPVMPTIVYAGESEPDNNLGGEGDVYLQTNSGITEELEELSGMVVTIDYVIAHAINNLNDRIDEISGNTGAGAEPLSAAVISLSASVVSDGNSVSSLSASVVTNKSNVTALSASVVTNKNSVSSLSASVVTNKSNVTALSASVVTNQSNITSLSASVVDNKNKVSAVTISLEELSGVVEDNEYVVARAFNDINDRLDAIEGDSGLTELSASVISNRDEISAATIGLETLSGMVESAITSIETIDEVTAAALVDLDVKITELSGEVTSISYMEETTWSALKTMRDGGTLTPGMWYRITDYNTTTVQEDTQAAGHQFDVIVLATDVNKLSEEARAVKHSGDTYFSGATLEGWKIWYCLDNDTRRFAWADTGATGRGVIYRMIDEWNNDIPYDFKNIQFKRKISLANGHPELVTAGTDTWVYTFAATSYHISNDKWSGLKDGSLESPYGHESDEDGSTFHDNVMGKYIKLFDAGDDDYTKCGIQYLNDNVFLGYWEEVGSSDPKDSPYYYAYCAYGNTFGVNCFSNTFGNVFQSNAFGNGCGGNNFGKNCRYNTFGNYCQNNTFGNSCRSNTFGNECGYNTFGNSCRSNTFGNECGYNTFGNGCDGNTFGNHCQNSTFGNKCSYNTFGNGCQNIGVQKDYVYYIIVENGNQHINITSTQTTSSSNKLMNFTISQGVNNTSTVKTISHNTVNDAFKTTYQNSNSTTVNV